MELRHLRYFVAVADARSVSRAAGRLGLTQPGLSRQVRDLAAELGVRLFERVGRRIELTPEGEDLLQRSRDLLAGAESIGDRARALQVGDAGILRVGATPQSLESVLVGFVARYRRGHPAVELQLSEDGGRALLVRLRRGELHLAVAAPEEGFGHRLLFPGRVIALLPRFHRLARRATLEVRELAREPLLLLRPDFAVRQLFDGACQVARVRPKVLLESSAPHTLQAFAQAGYGIGVGPSTMAFGTGVRAVPLLQDGRSLGAWVAVSWDPRRFLSAYAQAFVDELAAFTRRSYPGRALGRGAPPVPRPHLEPSEAIAVSP
jgi:DNA-binding transcriptional LysR family regulator